MIGGAIHNLKLTSVETLYTGSQSEESSSLTLQMNSFLCFFKNCLARHFTIKIDKVYLILKVYRCGRTDVSKAQYLIFRRKSKTYIYRLVLASITIVILLILILNPDRMELNNHRNLLVEPSICELGEIDENYITRQNLLRI